MAGDACHAMCLGNCAPDRQVIHTLEVERGPRSCPLIYFEPRIEPTGALSVHTDSTFIIEHAARKGKRGKP
jgi:hypothetical protein